MKRSLILLFVIASIQVLGQKENKLNGIARQSKRDRERVQPR